MWSSIKSSLKNAASEIVREAEEREMKEKQLVGKMSQGGTNPTETAASLFEQAAPQIPNYDGSTEAIDFFSSKPAEVEAFTGQDGVEQGSFTEASHVEPNAGMEYSIDSTLNGNGHSEPNPPGFDSIDLFNDLPEDAAASDTLAYGDGAATLARREIGMDRELSSPSSDRIDFDPSELEQVDLDFPGEAGSDSNNVDLSGYATTPMSKVAESPLSQAMRGTFQHLNKLKAMTTSAMSSTLPLQSVQGPPQVDKAVPQTRPAVDSSVIIPGEAKEQLFENMRKAKGMMLEGGAVAQDEQVDFYDQVDEELAAFWRSKRQDIMTQEHSLPRSKKENEQHNGMDTLQLGRRHEEELRKLHDQLRTAQAEVDSVRSQNANTNAEYEQRLEQLTAKNNALSQECETLLGEKMNLQQVANGKDQEIQALQQGLARTEKQMSELSTQAEQEMHAAASSGLEEVKEELAKVKSELEATRLHVETLETEKVELQGLLQKKMESLEREANESLEAKHAELDVAEVAAGRQQRDLVALRSFISQRRFEREAVQREIDAFNDSARSVQSAIEELKAVESSLSKDGANTLSESEAQLLQRLFNDNVSKALESTLAAPMASLEQAKRYAQVTHTLQRALVDALCARLKQRSLDDNPVSSLPAENAAIAEYASVKEPVDLVRSAATMLRMVSVNELDVSPILQRLAPFESTLENQSMEELERIAHDIAQIRLQAFGGGSSGHIEVKQDTRARENEGEKSSSVEEFVEHASRVLTKQHRLNKSLEDSLLSSVREILWVVSALLSGAAKWASDAKAEVEQETAEDDTTCDRRLAANVVTICIERNCRRDCLEVVARVLDFDADQRKRVGLDSGGGFWSAFIPNLSRGQAKAEQVNMEEQSLSSLLQDFIIDETS